MSNAVAVAVNTDSSSRPRAITRITTSPTNAAEPAVEGAFTEPVTGVDATDFALVTGGA